MNRAPSWSGALKVLCVRLDNMGDVLMTTPAVRALKTALPQRQITLLASSACAALGRFLPDVDKVLVYDAPWVKNNHDDVIADQGIIETLRQESFDAAVIFTVYSQSPLPAALICRLAGIPLTLAHCRENPYRLLSHWVRETEPERFRHEVQRQLDLVEYVGATNPQPTLSFETLKADRRRLYQKLNARGLTPDDTWVVAHCGATAPSRRYPAEYFVQAFRQLGGRAGVIMLTGDATERDLTHKIRQMCGHDAHVVDLAGVLSLGELACLIEDAALLLSNNTGPVHIAAALGTPVVDLYALTNPQHTPWMVPSRVLSHDVPCKYCYRSVCPKEHHGCLRGVAPAAVCDAVLDLMAECRQQGFQRFPEGSGLPFLRPAMLSEQEGTTC